ncbi:hypothetical protein H8356DRAFT_1086835 [Neocallimastix lanati (nom. inval.)]|nr:hypothetical protein H8356DRAFT_1086835 [Neocallimastix sp. JGI-2020a]
MCSSSKYGSSTIEVSSESISSIRSNHVSLRCVSINNPFIGATGIPQSPHHSQNSIRLHNVSSVNSPNPLQSINRKSSTSIHKPSSLDDIPHFQHRDATATIPEDQYTIDIENDSPSSSNNSLSPSQKNSINSLSFSQRNSTNSLSHSQRNSSDLHSFSFKKTSSDLHSHSQKNSSDLHSHSQKTHQICILIKQNQIIQSLHLLQTLKIQSLHLLQTLKIQSLQLLQILKIQSLKPL